MKINFDATTLEAATRLFDEYRRSLITPFDTASRLTLESAGMITPTRLLKINLLTA